MLFTDIEGSTALASRLGNTWREVLESHHAILSDAIAAEGGYVDGSEGDSFFATFSDPGGGVRAAVSAQRALKALSWPEEVGELRVRMGLHAGHVERGHTGYIGLEVHRAARVCAAAHGGQLLLTAAARELMGNGVPVELLGSFRLKDFPAPVQLYCAVIDGRSASSFPPPRTLDLRPTNLPAGLTPLVGRDQELQRLQEALIEEGERLVTLTGRGGSGKTSLALEAGTGLLDEHPGGVWWVQLSGVTSPDEVLGAIATAIGLGREVELSSSEAITARLRDAGPALVILDNIEHLLAATPDLARLLDSARDLRLLLTSQVPTRVPQEIVIPLDLLDDEAALALMERVARRRGTQLRGERDALLDVVRLVDGLPLALELAAARLPLLGPAALRDRLQTSLDLLKDPGTARPERQRSLEATIDWTLGLLEEAARELFLRLAVFAGPVELEEIEVVCGGDGLDVLEALSVLLDVALVRRIESGDGRVRFGLPEALRQIASRRLDRSVDPQRFRLAHAERQLAILSRSPFGTMDEFETALAANAESASALSWARDQDRLLADRIAVRRVSILATAGRLREAIAVLEPLLVSPPEDPDLRAEVLASDALVNMAVRRFDVALSRNDEAQQLAQSPRVRFQTQLDRGLILPFAGQAEAGVEACREAVRLARELDPLPLADALINETQALVAAGDLDQAAQTLEQARRAGEAVNAAVLRYFDTQLGDLAVARGRPAEALEPYARSLESAERRGDALQVFWDLAGVANALGALARDEDAVEVHALARSQAEDIGKSVLQLGEHLLGDSWVRSAAERLGPEGEAAARSRGHAVLPGQRVARACALARVPALAR
jgi:class 3 adenylate cyclase/predicted ATPase